MWSAPPPPPSPLRWIPHVRFCPGIFRELWSHWVSPPPPPSRPVCALVTYIVRTALVVRASSPSTTVVFIFASSFKCRPSHRASDRDLAGLTWIRLRGVLLGLGGLAVITSAFYESLDCFSFDDATWHHVFDGKEAINGRNFAGFWLSLGTSARSW